MVAKPVMETVIQEVEVMVLNESDAAAQQVEKVVVLNESDAAALQVEKVVDLLDPAPQGLWIVMSVSEVATPGVEVVADVSDTVG